MIMTTISLRFLPALLLGSAAACGAYDQVPGAPEVGSFQGELSSSSSSGRAWVWWGGAAPVSPSFSYNSAGGVNAVTALAVGRYRVDLPLMADAGGNVQVVAYGGGSERCKVESWGSGAPASTLSIWVRCHTSAGAPVNTSFVAYYHRSISSGYPYGAYLWADQPAAAAYTPATSYQWNPTGSYSTVARAGTGNYNVTLTGMTPSGGSVEVTAYGTGSEHCKVGSWVKSGSNTIVNVRCFSTAGAAADSRYTLNLHYTTMTSVGGYVWADNAAAAS
jgi:hypothetical protein